MNASRTTTKVSLLIAGMLGGTASAIHIETVPVGNPGNTADTLGHSGNLAGQGSVAYTYNIGKYEVTAGQYAAFLNAKATSDQYGLYDPRMSYTTAGSGINRRISPDDHTYTYSVDPAFVNRPVNYVTYWNACRFANWLHNGQGNGDTETGAYTLTPTGIADNTVTRNADWKWAVTSEDEWYKAAYHENDGVTGNYYDYPTSSDSAPGREMVDISGNNANYYGEPYPIDSGKYTTLCGEFQNSDSPYGTFDQGGNVREWTETVRGEDRRARGGSFYYGSYELQPWRRYAENPGVAGWDLGFRVSQVPEPASIVMLGLAGVGFSRRRSCYPIG